MSWYGDAWDWTKGKASDLMGSFDRSNNQYASQDRNDYNLPGMDTRSGTAMTAYRNAGDRQAQQANAFQARDSSFRGDQAAAAQYLGEQMRGQHLLSAEQLRQGQMSNVAAQQAAAASAGPGQQAMAQRMAMANSARQGYGMSGQAAMAGIAERNAAAGAYGQMAGQIRGQDLSLNQFNANQQQQNSQFNANQWLQTQAMNDAQQRGMLGIDLQNAQAQQQGGIAYQGDRTQRFNAAMSQPTSAERVGGYFQGNLQGGMSMLGMSDARNKEHVTDAGAEADEFMASIAPKSWEYKSKHKSNPLAGPGRYVGVMAQDLERSAAGKAAVSDTPSGKVVDYGKLGGVMTAALARLHARLAKVEGK